MSGLIQKVFPVVQRKNWVIGIKFSNKSVNLIISLFFFKLYLYDDDNELVKKRWMNIASGIITYEKLLAKVAGMTETDVTTKGVKSFFQRGTFTETLLIANLRYATKSIWTCAESEFRQFCWISDSHYTTARFIHYKHGI